MPEQSGAIDRNILDLLEAAWGIIANAGVPQSDWKSMSEECQEAATPWCDAYHKTISGAP